MRLLILLVFVVAVGCSATTETPTGKQTTPAVLDAPSLIDFGVVDTGAAKDTTFELFNSGTDTLHVLDQRFSSAAFSVDSTKFDIVGRTTHALTFGYRPTDVSEHAASDTIVTNVKNYIVQLHGRSTIPSFANNILFVGTDSGVFRSTDHGNRWIPTSSTKGLNNETHERATAFTFKRALYALTSQSLYRSTDLGDTWHVLQLSSTGITSVAAFDSMVFLSTNNSHILASSDGGFGWISYSISAGSNVTCFAKMTDSERYWAAGQVYYYWTPGMTTWTHAYIPYTTAGAMGYHSPNLFAAINGQGIIHSEEGNPNWQTDSSQLPAQLQFSSFLATKKALYFLSSQGLVRSLNNGVTWQLFGSHPPDLSGSPVLKEEGNQLMIGCASGFYRSFDQGLTWSESNSGLTNHNVNSVAILK
jgi:photosystem II stability/assembly factor-like uncharacterized protein